MRVDFVSLRGCAGARSRPAAENVTDALRASISFTIPPRQNVLFVGVAGREILRGLVARETLIVECSDPAAATSSLEWTTGKFDYAVLNFTRASRQSLHACLPALRKLCGPHTRLLVPHDAERHDAAALRSALESHGFEYVVSRTVTAGWPRSWRRLLSRSATPGHRAASKLGIYRPSPPATIGERPSLTICVTCRDERDNIEPLVRAIPEVAPEQEILFVEGHSNDGTREEIERIMRCYPDRAIRLISQPGKGQGDAIRTGFEQARGDIIILLEADMTSPPEDIIPVYEALRCRSADFVEGTRFAHPPSRASMPLVNRIGNRGFARYFSWLIRQPMGDVLCGIKGIYRREFMNIAARWGQWGIDDPFGDFELLFGAAQIGLKIAEVPVHYAPRRYGATKTRPLFHGAILMRMAWRAFRSFRR